MLLFPYRHTGFVQCFLSQPIRPLQFPRHNLETPHTTASNQRNSQCVGEQANQLEVIAFTHAISLYDMQQDFSRPRFFASPGQVQRVE
jgi:hypothetical protein